MLRNHVDLCHLDQACNILETRKIFFFKKAFEITWQTFSVAVAEKVYKWKWVGVGPRKALQFRSKKKT